ncbi:4-O-beta-D-mannosyl-D-glucose phosphorylase [Arenicella sp. 4NH20-0111]|uniref:glycoside hydrolase family 130 protein n=1 Tax=Arenicella sp. 4NH20-0111 TaxID=3127648 RepID=UPI00310BCD8A
MSTFDKKIETIVESYESVIQQKNSKSQKQNGIFSRWQHPVVTKDHIPPFWRYDFDPSANPFLLERLGVNATLNSGALLWQGRYIVVVRVEGNDRKSFFAVAESPNGIDNFEFWDYPITMPETERPDVNVYDMRLTEHEDGYIYGLFCTERKDGAYPDDTSAAEAGCGIARTKDLVEWERLPDLESSSGQQRNVVLHPEYVEGEYAFYTRPQDGFIEVGGGGGIGFGTCKDIENPVLADEMIVDGKVYHTIKEVKNGQGPAPIRTDSGWMHLAHGVRNTAAGLRYVLYMFMTELDRPWVVTHRPGGHLIAPEGSERVGDVSNVVFSNGWIVNDNQEVFIYYASSDTRLHVATTTVEKLVDYVINTPEDGLRSAASVDQRNELIRKNLSLLGSGRKQSA